MNPRTVCLCHPIFSMISTSVAPFFLWSMATTWAVLLPSRGPALSSAFAGFGALGASGSFLALGALAGGRRRQCNRFDFGLKCSIFQGPAVLHRFRLGDRQLGGSGPRFGRVERRLGNRRCGRFTKALKRFPDALGRRLPVSELGD